MLNMIYGDFADQRWNDQRESNVIDGAAPFYNVYRCKDDKWVAFAGIEPQFYSKFIEISGLPGELLDQQWARDKWPAQKLVLQDYFAGATRDAWISHFEKFDVCLTPVLSLAEAQQHPHNIARQAFVLHQQVLQAAPAPRFGKTAGKIQPQKVAKTINEILITWGAN